MVGGDVLLTLAEVSVAFAGFSSVVVLFVHRDPANWPPAVPARLRAMVESSLGTLYASLLPSRCITWASESRCCGPSPAPAAGSPS